MGDSKSSARAGGIGFLGMFFLVLFVLKVTGYIRASWFWITMPLWGGLALFVAFLVAVAGVLLVAGAFDLVRRKLRRRR